MRTDWNWNSYYAAIADEKKNIIVQPGKAIKAGVTNKPNKASYGWLRVGVGAEAVFYRLPTEKGILDSSCARIIDEIERQTKSGLTAHWQGPSFLDS